GSVWVTGNARALEQVLTNLLSNAVKYNTAGGFVRVNCSMAGSSVLIAVDDEGPGMTAEQQARLFHPFDRLGAETGSVQGPGLGLVIARELTLAMGGDLRVSSTPGAGTTFTVVMQAADPFAVNASSTSDARASTQAPAALRRRHVLYVEDEPVNVMLM